MRVFRIRIGLVMAALLIVMGGAITQPQSVLAVDAGSRAPGFSLKDFKGKPVSLASLKGKVVLVDFWASWCAPCKKELPELNKLHAKYGSKGLVIIGVNIDEDVKAAKRFLRKVPVDFPVVHDAAHSVAKSYAPPTMPSSYIIDRKGVIRHVQVGFKAKDAKVLEAQVKKLL